MKYTKIKAINEYVSESINPMKSPDTVFEMYSVPIFDTGHPEYLRGDEIASNKVVVKKNDVLLCKINPRINRVWVVADESEHINIASSEWIVVRNKSYNPHFLAWYFRSPRFKQLMVSEVTGIGGSLTRAQPKAVAEYPVPVLARAEQDKITIVLNKIASLIEARKQELRRLDELIKARFVEMFGEDRNPSVKLMDLIIDGAGLSYGIVQPGDDGTGDMGVLRPVDMVDGKISLNSIKYIDRSIGDGYKRTELTGEELLITVRGTTGITALTDVRFRGMNVTRGIAVIRFDSSKINPVYLNTYLNASESQRYIQEHTRGATLQQINLSDLRELEITIPPMDLQEQFALFAIQVDKSKAVIQKSLEEAQLLFDSLMQQYFG